ncbi:unnamed protein product [Closterium sp. Naga37s-1]|nr:unnamed protein product [Closterium sp. Naga37s-1]
MLDHVRQLDWVGASGSACVAGDSWDQQRTAEGSRGELGTVGGRAAEGSLASQVEPLLIFSLSPPSPLPPLIHSPSAHARQHMRARLTDFGMARAGPEEGKTHVSTQIKGTLGYLDPEYMDTGHLAPTSCSLTPSPSPPVLRRTTPYLTWQSRSAPGGRPSPEACWGRGGWGGEKEEEGCICTFSACLRFTPRALHSSTAPCTAAD